MRPQASWNYSVSEKWFNFWHLCSVILGISGMTFPVIFILFHNHSGMTCNFSLFPPILFSKTNIFLSYNLVKHPVLPHNTFIHKIKQCSRKMWQNIFFHSCLQLPLHALSPNANTFRNLSPWDLLLYIKIVCDVWKQNNIFLKLWNYKINEIVSLNQFPKYFTTK